MEVPTCVLTDPAVTACRDIEMSDDGLNITLLMSSTQTVAKCPKCGQSSSRVHSRYQRRLADLPWAHASVKIQLTVRRFFCDHGPCSRAIFAERLPTLAVPWARRTQRLALVQQKIGLIAGASGGAALCSLLACPVGVDTLLSFIRQTPVPTPMTPRVLGVDDWAMRKGQRYGTILVDHERACVVDVLEDRKPQTLAQWLRDHPGVEIVTRDRAEAYAQGITEGAPAAVQVADRWHVLKNLTDAMTKILQDHQVAIDQLLTADPPVVPKSQSSTDTAPANITATIQALQLDTLPIDRPAISLADQRRQRQAEQAHDLRNKGWTLKAIAQQLNLATKTICRYLARTLPLRPHPPVRHSKLDAFKDHLIQRWNAGCHNAAQLLREIRLQGFEGARTIVTAFIATLRHIAGLPARSRRPGGISIQVANTKRRPSSRTLAWMSTQPPHELDEAQTSRLTQIANLHPALKTAFSLAASFAGILRGHTPEVLDDWLIAATQSNLKPLQSLASGIRADLAAMRAAITLPWSNGRTEGYVNRLKCLKRHMYGRAKLDLLRIRLMAV